MYVFVCGVSREPHWLHGGRYNRRPGRRLVGGSHTHMDGGNLKGQWVSRIRSDAHFTQTEKNPFQLCETRHGRVRRCTAVKREETSLTHTHSLFSALCAGRRYRLEGTARQVSPPSRASVHPLGFNNGEKKRIFQTQVRLIHAYTLLLLTLFLLSRSFFSCAS